MTSTQTLLERERALATLEDEIARMYKSGLACETEDVHARVKYKQVRSIDAYTIDV